MIFLRICQSRFIPGMNAGAFVSKLGKKELRSEFTAADEINNHISPNKKPGVMTLSAAERARANARKKSKSKVFGGK